MTFKPTALLATVAAILASPIATAEEEQTNPVPRPIASATDLGNGQALLIIREEVPWPLAMAILDRLRLDQTTADGDDGPGGAP